jgi:hypothetical protein
MFNNLNLLVEAMGFEPAVALQAMAGRPAKA